MKMHPIQRFFRLLKLDKKDITYVYLYAIFAGLITLTLPLGIQAIIGLIAGGEVSSSWALLVGVVTFGTALAGALTVMQLSVTEAIQRRIFTRSAFDFAFRLPRMKTEALYREYAPELVNRFFDTLTLQKGLPKILMDFSTGVLQVFFGLLLLAFYHPFFIFFGFILLAVLLLIVRVTAPKGLKTSLVESKYKYEVASWLEELARTMNTFKLAGQSELPLQKTDYFVNGYLKARKQHFRVLMTQYSSIVAFKTLITASLLILGSLLAFDNRINIGQFVAAEIVIILVVASVEKLILTMDTIYDVLTALDKIGLVTDLPVERGEGIPYEQIQAEKGISVRLQGVSYLFPGSDRPTLNELDFDIKAGEKVCVAGYNGSGKSTLLRVVTGVYTEYKGSLSFNDIPARNLDLVSLRSHIGDYLSDEDIFKGSLMENISMGHTNIALPDVVQAVQAAGLEGFVRQLPEGYDTVLLQGGKNLPRSVVAKIILARSIASRPSLLAIETPTSLLEQEERERFSNILTAANAPWTLIAVSNDPALAAKCDRVFIMQGGKIVAEGDFGTIKKSKHYKFVFE